MNSLKYILIYLSVIMLSCNSTNNSTQTMSKESSKDRAIKSQKMISDGYKKGIVKATDNETNCPYMIEIQDEDSKKYFDPVDLPEEFKRDGVNIWFKFTPSRRMQRCEKANPILLNNAIYLRE